MFLWEPGARSSTDAIAKGIDTRGGASASKCTSHINVFPSSIGNNKYLWEKGGAISHIPEWIREKMGIVANYDPRFSTGSGRGNENVEDRDVERPIPPDQVKRMLGAIDPNNLSYDEWLRVGQSVNTQIPDEAGLQLWDEWSSKGKRYKNGECATRWRGFNPDGPIRAGTLFFIAKEAGWEVTPEDTTTATILHDEIVERMNKTFAVVLIGGKMKILRERLDDSDLIMGHYDIMGRDDFRHFLENEKVQVGKQQISVADLWLPHGLRRTFPLGLVLAPDNNVPPGAYNTWNGFAVKEVKGDWGLFEDHIYKIICKENDDIFTWVLDWCADMVQNPASPPGTAIVLRGEEGTGKGTFADNMGQLVGSHYRHLIDDSHLTSNFNAHMIDALFVFADEITWGGNKKSSGKLKGLVTERTLLGERKGIDAISYKNMVRMMIASNDSWVVPAGKGSRRWAVLDVSKKRIGDRAYFDDLNDQLDNGGREAFMYDMQNRIISSNLGVAPVTQALREQRAMSAGNDTVLQWWINVLTSGKLRAPCEEETTDGWPIQVQKHVLYHAYETWCIDRHKMTETQMKFYTSVKQFGLKSSRRGGKADRRYVALFLEREELVKILATKFNVDIHEEDTDDD